MSVSQRLTEELGRANEKRNAIDASISQGNADLLSLDAADDGARKAARDNIRALSDELAEWDERIKGLRAKIASALESEAEQAKNERWRAFYPTVNSFMALARKHDATIAMCDIQRLALLNMADELYRSCPQRRPDHDPQTFREHFGAAETNALLGIKLDPVTGRSVESIIAVAEEFQAIIMWRRPAASEADEPKAENSSQPQPSTQEGAQ